MLNEEERKAFLALLEAFAAAVSLSMASTARLFGISASSLSRWLAPSDVPHGVARWVANPVSMRIRKLNEVNEKTGLYQQLTELPRTARVERLKEVLRDPATWA